jgi:hypothetical protein
VHSWLKTANCAYLRGDEDMYCEHCGRELKATAEFCKFCGTAVNDAQNGEKLDDKGGSVPDGNSDIYGVDRSHFAPANHTPRYERQKFITHNGNEPKVDLNDQLYAASTLGRLIGENHAEYYAKQFMKIKRGERTNFNWAVFIGGPIVPLYRRNFEYFRSYYLPYIIANLIFVIIAVLYFVKAINKMTTINEGSYSEFLSGLGISAIAGCAAQILLMGWGIVLLVKTAKNYNLYYKNWLEAGLDQLNTRREANMKYPMIYSLVVFAMIVVIGIGGNAAALASIENVNEGNVPVSATKVELLDGDKIYSEIEDSRVVYQVARVSEYCNSISENSPEDKADFAFWAVYMDTMYDIDGLNKYNASGDNQVYGYCVREEGLEKSIDYYFGNPESIIEDNKDFLIGNNDSALHYESPYYYIEYNTWGSLGEFEGLEPYGEVTGVKQDGDKFIVTIDCYSDKNDENPDHEVTLNLRADTDEKNSGYRYKIISYDSVYSSSGDDSLTSNAVPYSTRVYSCDGQEIMLNDEVALGLEDGGTRYARGVVTEIYNDGTVDVQWYMDEDTEEIGWSLQYYNEDLRNSIFTTGFPQIGNYYSGQLLKLYNR